MGLVDSDEEKPPMDVGSGVTVFSQATILQSKSKASSSHILLSSPKTVLLVCAKAALILGNGEDCRAKHWNSWTKCITNLTGHVRRAEV